MSELCLPQILTIEPLAGTIARTGTLNERRDNTALAQKLVNDSKEILEHMISVQVCDCLLNVALSLALAGAFIDFDAGSGHGTQLLVSR